MAGASGLVLRCMGDGRAGYKISLKTDAAWDGVSYQASFVAPTSEGNVRIPFGAFRATFRGQPVPNAPPLRGEDVCVLGIMLSRFDAQSGLITDEPAGSFSLQLYGLEPF